jgi:hypothetical protein
LSLELAVIFLLFMISFVSSYYAVKFGLLLLSLEDDIEESLDDIDESFKALSEILKKPIFFDSLEVRQCITEIRNCRSVVVKIADRLTSFGDNNQIGEKSRYDYIREKENS